MYKNDISEGEIMPASPITTIETQIQNLGDLDPVTFRVSRLVSSRSDFLFFLMIQPMNKSKDTTMEQTSEAKVLTNSPASASPGSTEIPRL
mmetsp:Transcript_11147/g.12558  ORF Transcript_11147/g.12558 Transcript_11147/m.12558 type:complete len:91 (-) Transcript_11147:625-897(-)